MNGNTLNCVKATLQCYIQELIDKASRTNMSEKTDNETKCGECTKMKHMISFTESNICIRVIIKISLRLINQVLLIPFSSLEI